MAPTLNRKHLTRGAFGQELFARGASIRSPDMLVLLQNATHGRDQWGRRWFPWAMPIPQIADPSSGVLPQLYGPPITEVDHTGFNRRIWTKVTLSPGRKRLQVYVVHGGGTVRYRYRPSGGAYGSYTTSSARTKFATSGWGVWPPTVISGLTAGGEYEFEVEFQAISATGGEECYVLAAMAMEPDMDSADF